MATQDKVTKLKIWASSTGRIIVHIMRGEYPNIDERRLYHDVTPSRVREIAFLVDKGVLENTMVMRPFLLNEVGYTVTVKRQT